MLPKVIELGGFLHLVIPELETGLNIIEKKVTPKSEFDALSKKVISTITGAELMLQACHYRKHRTCGCRMPKQHFIAMTCYSKPHAIILW